MRLEHEFFQYALPRRRIWTAFCGSWIAPAGPCPTRPGLSPAAVIFLRTASRERALFCWRRPLPGPSGFCGQISRDEPGHLGGDAGPPEAELPCCAYMDTVAVLPEARGNRLHIRLLAAAEQALSGSARCHWLATVHLKTATACKIYSLRLPGRGYQKKIRRPGPSYSL